MYLIEMKRSLRCAAGLVFPAFLGASMLVAQPKKSDSVHGAARCAVRATNYDGWKAEELSNPWVKLIIVPQLAGRLMQVTFDGHDFLFVNGNLKGQVIPPAEAGTRWNNYGGDKIWPMPEGNQDEQHWAGAGGEPLDNSPFVLRVLSQGKRCAVRLTGPVDPAIGQQYTRDISIGPETPVISFHAVMKNVTGYPQTWSEQSVSQYNAADPKDSAHANTRFLGITAANDASVFPGGYHSRNGNQSNPAYSVSNGLFKVNWGAQGAQGGEVWVDSPAGWLAVVDGATDFTMVERNHFDPKATYPGQTTMIFFTTGQRSRPAPAGPGPSANGANRGNATGSRGAGNVPARASEPVIYMEAEVNSPMVELGPGESYAMDTTWYPTRMGDEFKTTTWGGVVGQPLSARVANGSLTLSGEFGVFYEGNLVAHYYNRGGQRLGNATLMSVKPTEQAHLQAVVAAPAETFRVSVHVVDKDGTDRGPLGEAFVDPPPPAPARQRGGGQ